MASVSEPTTPVSLEQVKVKEKFAPGSITMTSLYVCDLDTSVTKTQLEVFFSEAGSVLSVKVCRDHISEVSLGHGYVNYGNPQDARKALKLLNFKPINGKAVRISLSRQDCSIQRNARANLYFKDFPLNLDCKALHELFSTFGIVLSIKLVTDAKGVSKGYGYVQYDQEEAAKKAIVSLHEMVVNDELVFVAPFVSKEERDKKDDQVPVDTDRSVFVGNVSRAADNDDLYDVFYPCESVHVVSGKGFGFVTFKDRESASSAIERLNGYKRGNHIWYVGWIKKKADRISEKKKQLEQRRLQGANLYVKNLDPSINDESFKEIFSKFGEVTSCKVMLDFRGQNRGFGFVAFTTVEDATKAMKEMNGKMVGPRPLYVAVAQNKEERKAMLKKAHATQVQEPFPYGQGSLTYHPGGYVFPYHLHWRGPQMLGDGLLRRASTIASPHIWGCNINHTKSTPSLHYL